MPRRPIRPTSADDTVAAIPPPPPADGEDEDPGEIDRYLQQQEALAAAAKARKEQQARGGQTQTSMAIHSFPEGENSPAARAQCRPEIGTVFLYGDVGHMDVGSAEECCAQCDAHRECEKWSFGFKGKLAGKCMLRSEEGWPGKNAEVVSGWRTTPLPPAKLKDEL
eukprot:g621.t1